MSDPRQSVTGSLSAFSIFDITQSLMVGQRSATVTIQSGVKKGTLSFEGGQITAAIDHQLRNGDRAVMEIFAWDVGEFSIDFETPPLVKNVNTPTDHLLLEVARTLDEARRDRGVKSDNKDAQAKTVITKDVEDRVENQIKNQVNAVFKRVALTSGPTRSRYSLDAFDSLLQALLELSGTVLFLKPGQRPRVRTATGFAIIKDEAIERSEIEGFLRTLLSETEALRLRETKEVSTFFQSPASGPFRVVAVDEQGTFVLTITPCDRMVPKLEDACRGTAAIELLQNTTEGLIVLAGPLGVGKGVVLDATVKGHLKNREAFAFQFARGSSYNMAGEYGFCVRRALPATPLQFHDALRAALDQAPDLITFCGAQEREAFPLALSACGIDRLVLFTLESHSSQDTLKRLFHLSRTAFGDSMEDALSERLKAIIDLSPGARGEPPTASVLTVDREIQMLFAKGDLAGLLHRRAQVTV